MLKSIVYILFGCLFVAPSIAQNISADKIGDFEFKVADKMGWKASLDAKLQAENILKYEQIKLTPSFAYTNSSGSLVYGTLKIFRDGLAFSAEQLASSMPQFPEAWGIKNNGVQNNSESSVSGLRFAVMRVSGPGDGKIFGRGKPYKTLGVWIDIPVQYQDINGYHSVLISLFYRGFDSKKFSDENFLKSVINSISPVAGASIITEKKYKEQFEPVKPEVGKISRSEPQKVVQVEISADKKTEPQKVVQVEFSADKKTEPQELVQVEISADRKIELQKLDSAPKNKDAEVLRIPLLDIIKEYNVAARSGVSQQSNAMANGFGCESPEIINEQSANPWLSITNVLLANLKSHKKCFTALVSHPSGAVNSKPADK